jgi:hypothetical protein
MARGRGGNVQELDEVDAPEVDETEVTDEVETTEGGEQAEKPAKAKKEPAKGDLPEGYVTPVGLAKELSKPKDGNPDNDDADNWYHTGKNGLHEVKPQMVYSYIKNAPENSKAPIETVQDSIGGDRQVFALQAGLDWWDAKNARVNERKASASAKEQAKAERAAKKAAESNAEESVEAEATEEVLEAE